MSVCEIDTVASPCISEAMDAAAALRAAGSFCDTPFSTSAEAIQVALELVMHFVGVRTAFVTRIEDQNLEILDAYARQGCPISTGMTTSLEHVYCQYVRATHGPIIIPDAARDGRVRELATRVDLAMGAYIGVPLCRADGSLYGTLCAADPEPRPLDSTHAAFMNILAHRIVTLLEQEASRAEESTPSHTAIHEMLDQQIKVLHAVSHDLRTPLTTIRGYVDMISEGFLGAINEPQQEALQRVRRTVQWMNRLVNDLVDVASLEAQTFALLTAEYQPHMLARQVVDMCQPQATERKLTLSLAHDRNLASVLGDADRVQQVLLNLVSNALRYTTEGSVVLNVEQHANSIEFRVTDTGPGIAPEIRADIWKLYNRGFQQGQGLGLGLYVVQRLVTAMRGTVGVDSELGKGSSFWVRLPLQSPPPHNAFWR